MRILWRGFAVIVIVTALLVGLARLALPSLGDYRKEIETWTSQALGHPVRIGSIQAEWRGALPKLHVTDVRVLDPTRSRVILRFDQGSASLDLVASLKQGRVMAKQLSLGSVEFTVVRALDGRIAVAGFTGGHRIASWLLEQPNVAIYSARLTWLDQKAQWGPAVLTEVRLEARSQGDHHKLAGSVKLPAEMGDGLKFVLDARGELLTEDWSGALYLEGWDLKPAFLLNYPPRSSIGLAGGEIQIRTWSSWAKAELIDLIGDFTAASMDIAAAQEHLKVSQAAARFAISPVSPGGFRIDVDQLAITTPQGPWPEKSAAQVVVAGPKQSHGRAIMAYASFLRLEDLAPLLQGLSILPTEARARLRRLKPRGDLREARLHYFPGKTGAERFFISTRFSGITTRPLDKIPGIKRLAGALFAHARGGRLQLSGSSLELDFNKLFTTPLQVDTLAGELRWQWQDHGWIVSTPHLQAANQDLALTLSGDLTWTPRGGATADLAIALDNGRTNRVWRYLPTLVPERDREWLRSALVGGSITSGHAVLRGPLKQFPFDRREGEFKAALSVTGGGLEYSSHWPSLEELEASLQFKGRALTIQARRGKTSGIEILDTTAHMELGSAQTRLQVHGQARGSVAKAQDFIRHTPLKKTVGKRIEALAIQGELGLDLGLEIPLANPQQTVVQGVLSLPANIAAIKGMDLKLTKLSGALSFTEDALSGKELKAELFGRPVRIDIKDDQKAAWIRLKGKADRTFLAERLGALWPSNPVNSNKLLEAIKGETDWQVRIDLTRPWNDSQAGESLRLSSQLVGLRIDAPAPLGKTLRQPRPFVLKTSLAESSSRRITLEYGDIQAMLTFIKRRQALSLKQALIQAGSKTVPSPSSAGISIGGRLEEFSLSQWAGFLHALGSSSPFFRSPYKLPPIAIDVTVSRLEGWGNRFDDVHILADNTSERWKLQIDGEEAAGTIQVSSANTLEARLSRLTLAHPALDSQSLKLDPSKLPGLSVTCDQFIFGSSNLGKMALITYPDPRGLKLESLTLASPDFNIEAQGEWRSKSGSPSSGFDILVHGPNLGKLLKRFNYSTTALEGGQTQVDIHAWWLGTPAEFALSRLNGRLKVSIKDGRLPNIDQPAVGRIFGLLSIRNLPRRLALDFSDLFGKGFSFDTLAGNFTVENGQAYTNHLSMIGPSAYITITGRTGLVAQDYDLRVTVIPDLVSSLPAAGAFFGPVGAGVGAGMLLAEWVFPSLPEQIDKILQRRYTVTGSWSNPVVKE